MARFHYPELLPAVPPLEPSPRALRRLDRVMALFGGPLRFILRRRFGDVEVSGLEHLAKGPALVLPSHSCYLDPFLISLFTRKNIQFLVTEPFMAERRVARLMAWVGQIPKRKLLNDTLPLRTMKKWVELGAHVGTFPTGQLSCDGRPRPVMPGLRNLVLYLGVPVVTMRILNGDRLWPEWATVSRRSKVRIEIDPPVVFRAEDDIDRIVSERILVDPDNTWRSPARGTKLALGLVRFLRYCPQCSADQSLREAGNRLECTSCKLAWDVTPDNRIVCAEEPSKSRTISEAWAAIRARIAGTFPAAATIRSLADVEIIDATRPQWVKVDCSPLTAGAAGLSTASWSLPADEILAHMIDWGDLILVRTPKKRFAIRLPGDSRALWSLVLDLLMGARKVQSGG